jgi:hypothetical protein
MMYTPPSFRIYPQTFALLSCGCGATTKECSLTFTISAEYSSSSLSLFCVTPTRKALLIDTMHA